MGGEGKNLGLKQRELRARGPSRGVISPNSIWSYKVCSGETVCRGKFKKKINERIKNKRE